ncbi:MAG: hypothetical protein MUD11_00365, partial [Rhodobacteraceae bacterium]|nr:hypothetical protein [Paracoccaceae bacterium]
SVVNATQAQVYDLGRGNDFVRTTGFNDTYIYRNGDGHDVIEERGANSDVYVDPMIVDVQPYVLPGGDTLSLPDLMATDLAFLRDGDDLVVQILADPGRGIVPGSVRLVAAFLTTARYLARACR